MHFILAYGSHLYSSYIRARPAISLPFAICHLPLATHALRPLKLLRLILDLLLISYLRLEHEGKGDANANLRPASRSLLPSFRTNVRQSHMYDLP